MAPTLGLERVLSKRAGLSILVICDGVLAKRPVLCGIRSRELDYDPPPTTFEVGPPVLKPTVSAASLACIANRCAGHEVHSYRVKQYNVRTIVGERQL